MEQKFLLRTMSLLLLLLIVICTLSILPIKSEENILLNINEKYKIQKLGGNVVCTINIDLVADRIPDKISLIFNKQLGKRIVGFSAYIGEDEIPIRVDINNNYVKYDLLLKEITFIDKSTPINVTYIIKTAFEEEDSKTYKLVIPYIPIINYPLESLNISIMIPRDIELMSFPRSFKEEVNDVYRTLYINLHKQLANEKMSSDIYMTLKTRYEFDIQLITVTLTRKIYTELDGRYLVFDYIQIFNHHNSTLTKGFKIKCYISKNIDDISAYSVVNQPLDFDIKNDIIELPLPHDVKSGEKAGFILKYYINNLQNKQINLDSNTVEINLKQFITMDYLIEKMKINIYSYNENIINTIEYENISSINSISITLPLIYTPLNPISAYSYILYIPIVLGLFIFIYRTLSNISIVITGLPRDYREKIKQQLSLMKKIIDLEKKYMSGEVKAKDYIKQKNRLFSESLKLEKEIIKIERDLTRKTQYGQSIMETRKRNSELLKEVKDLESLYLSRKITHDDFKKRKKELLSEIENVIAQLSSFVD